MFGRALAIALVLGVAAVAIVALRSTSSHEARGSRSLAIERLPAPTAVPTVTPQPTSTPVATPTATATPTVTPTPTATPTPEVFAPVQNFRLPWSEQVRGLLTFRGSPSRSFHGEGPVPTAPVLQWSYPERAMCAESAVGEEVTLWCGTGWTGQPAVWERDEELWLAFGAFDRNVHFLDALTGEQRLSSFPTGDIIKGSVTIDPDGYPLLYTGSRDNFLRVISFEGDAPVELWSLDARTISPRLWNDDWDGAPLVVGDWLIEGGENSVLHVVDLNRSLRRDGGVTVSPELIATVPGWDDELLAAVGGNVSIENSVAMSGDTVWFANSGGLVQGWDLGPLDVGEPPEQVFRYWVGDDVDASIVVDDEGFLYVAAEYERANQRSRDVGQLIKLDPSASGDPLVWSVADSATSPAGLWATPAVTADMVYASTNGGRLLGVDRFTGAIVWEKRLPGPLWSSQLVVDDVLIQGDCAGGLHAYDVSDPTVDPPELWTVQLNGCIESTPALWDGGIWVGTRGGRMHYLADDPDA